MISTTEVINNIEEEYKLQKLESWQYLRVHYAIALERKKYSNCDNNIKESFKSKIKQISRVFNFGFINLFRSYNYIVFDTNDDFRNIKGQYLSRLTERISLTLNKKNILHIQSFWNTKVKPSNDNYIDDFIISVLSLVLYKFKKTRELDFDYSIINDKLGLDIDFLNIYQKSLIRKNILKSILKIYKPKIVFVTCYTKRSEMISAKELEIPVVELQHGIVNKPGYVGKNFNKNYQPDYLLVFGTTDKKLFLKNSNYINDLNNIFPVGSFLLDYIINHNSNKLDIYKNQFDKIVSISLQDAILDDTVEFVLQAAKNLKNTLFIPIIRNQEIDIKLNNVKIIKEMSCLEIVNESDFHLTVFSTCAYEATSLGVPNIFWNHNNLSREYFQDYIHDKNYNFIVSNIEELSEVLNRDLKFDKKDIIYQNKDYFMDGYSKNIEIFLSNLNNESKI